MPARRRLSISCGTRTPPRQGTRPTWQIWQKFKADNPDINLNQEILFSNAYHDKLTAYIAAGQMPDVFYLWPSLKDSSAIVQSKKLAKDLKVLLGADFLKDFAATALDPNQQSSKMLLELPQSFTFTSVMYTNKKLLSDLGIPLPKTYADLKAMVVKLKVKNIQTILLPDGDGWPGESCLFSTIVDRLLGDSFQDQLMTGKAKFTGPGLRQRAEVLADHVHRRCHVLDEHPAALRRRPRSFRGRQGGVLRRR